MNDITSIPWSKLLRGLPSGRRYSHDRAPTIEEIRQIIEYPDRRIKAIVYTMVSGGIRVGAWDYLQWGHVMPIERVGVIVAAKIRVYADEEDGGGVFYIHNTRSLQGPGRLDGISKKSW